MSTDVVDRPVDVLVAIPAHDEASTIGACLDSVVAAVRHARRAGAVDRALIAVAAHRCVDDTRDRATAHLAACDDLQSLVRVEPEVMPVGRVRTRLIAAAADAGEPLASTGWILSTDADTVVPLGWVTGLLAAAQAAAADLVVGLAELDLWAVDTATRDAYRAIVDAGIHADRHDHVYAANLAVSWDAFRAVGGFPAVPHGEERALLEAVRRSGRRVASPLSPRVVTSSRMPGRAADGLGDLLALLAGPGADVSSAVAASDQ